MKKNWFFDLEETIIKSWNDPVICNLTQVREFIEKNSIKEISIFSAAIWDQKDLETFNTTLKLWLEEILEVNIIDVITMEMVWKQSLLKFTKFDSVQELLLHHGKHKMFIDWCLSIFRSNSHCVLLDDSFGNTVFINKDKNVTVETVDVNKL